MRLDELIIATDPEKPNEQRNFFLKAAIRKE
jgi:hypothetical protein